MIVTAADLVLLSDVVEHRIIPLLRDRGLNPQDFAVRTIAFRAYERFKRHFVLVVTDEEMDAIVEAARR